MSAVQRMPVSTLEEQSGWWPSDRSAKARFKAFFHRSKSDKPVRRHNEPVSTLRDPRVGPQARHNSEAVGPNHGLPYSTHSHAKSSQSTASAGRVQQHSTKQYRPRASWTPPPLFHAYSQAIMHEFLDIPSTLTDVLFRGHSTRRNSISSETPSRPSLDNVSPTHVGHMGFKHQRNASNLSACSLNQKLFVLSAWGYVLQYSADGLNDRLPEKTLELGPESVAFASDAIPGRPWVLQISHDGTLTQFPSHSSKSSWSKLAFRHNDNKKLVKDLLLVFDNAKSLGNWLTSVRKEIEKLGGLEYRPDSTGPGEDEPVVQPRNPLRTQKSLPVFSHSSPHLPTREFTTRDDTRNSYGRASPDLLPPMPSHWNTSRNVSRSTTESSINTLSSLDRMREASFSDDHSISTTHTSLTSYNSSPTQAMDSFSSVESFDPTIHAGSRSRVSTPTQDDIGDMEMMMATPKRNDRVIPPRSSSLDNSADMISHDLFVQKPLPPIVDNSPKPTSRERPISIIAPLPEPGHIRKTSARYRYDSQGIITLPQTPTSMSRPTSMTPGSASTRPPSVRSRSSSCTQDSPDGTQRRTPSYSLFPKSATEQPRLLPSGLSSPQGVSPTSPTDNVCRYQIPQQEETVSRSRASSHSGPSAPRTLSVDIEAATVAAGQPPRSPAVTEAHIQSCFGANAASAKLTRPKLRTGNRSLSGNAISTMTREAMMTPTAEATPFKLADAPKRHQMKTQKSMPSLVHKSIPPSGPPPTGPLPALPPTPTTCLPMPIRPGTAKGRSPVSLTLNCIPTCESTMENKVQSPAMRSPPPPPLPPKSNCRTASMCDSTKQLPTRAAPSHKRDPSTLSTSSIDSVRHVTEWLSSPRVAAFGAKYDPENTGKPGPTVHSDNANGNVTAKGKSLLLSVALPESPMFKDGFDHFVMPKSR